MHGPVYLEHGAGANPITDNDKQRNVIKVCGGALRNGEPGLAL